MVGLVETEANCQFCVVGGDAGVCVPEVIGRWTDDEETGDDEGGGMKDGEKGEWERERTVGNKGVCRVHL